MILFEEMWTALVDYLIEKLKYPLVQERTWRMLNGVILNVSDVYQPHFKLDT